MFALFVQPERVRYSDYCRNYKNTVDVYCCSLSWEWLLSLEYMNGRDIKSVISCEVSPGKSRFHCFFDSREILHSALVILFVFVRYFNCRNKVTAGIKTLQMQLKILIWYSILIYCNKNLFVLCQNFWFVNIIHYIKHIRSAKKLIDYYSKKSFFKNKNSYFIF